MPNKLQINALIEDGLSKLPEDDVDISVLRFLIRTVLDEWVSPENLEDTLLLEAVLRIFRDHFFLLGPIDQVHAKQLRTNILSFLSEDDEFNKKIEEKIKRLKRQSRLNDKLLKQFRDIVNSSEGINFIPSDEQQSLLTSGLGIYQENNRLFINRFYADHSLIVNFLKYIFWELLKCKLSTIIRSIIPPPTIVNIYIFVIFTSIVSTMSVLVLYEKLHPQIPPTANKPSASSLDKIATLCDAKQYGDLKISCGHKGEDKNKPDFAIYKNNQEILEQIKSGKLNEKQVYPIAAVVPLSGRAKEVGDDILQGVADKQTEYNNNQKSKLLVLIADDENETSIAQNVAKRLGKIKVLLGVVGSFSSSTSTGVIQIYRNDGLVLISPTTSATLDDLKKAYYEHIDNQSDLNTSFFFRPVGTTKHQISDVLQYLKDKNKKNVILFWDSGDTYVKSLKKEFYEQNKNLSIFPHDSNGVTAAKLGSIIEEMVSKPDRFQQDSTAILIFQGAYKNPLERETPRKKAIEIIRANQGYFLVIGSNPVYRTDLMCEFINGSNFTQISSRLLIIQPWFPEFDSDLYPQPLNCNNTNSQDSHTPWRLAMSQDATQMLIYAINKASENGDPTPEKIQKALMGDEIQDETCTDKNKGIKENVLTGNITLHGSDRCNPSSELVRPLYLKDTEQWQWQKLPKSYK